MVTMHRHEDNKECVRYLRSIIREGVHPFEDIRDDQCCACYFAGEEECIEMDENENNNKT